MESLDAARRLHGAGQPEQAIPLYLEALSLLGDGEAGARVLLWLAGAFCDAGRRDEAVEACRFAIRIDPGSMPAHSILAGILLELGRADEAARAARDALDRCPEDVGVLDLATGIALARGRAAEARGLAEASLARQPANQRALSHLALALIELGDTAQVAPLLDFDRLLQVRRLPLPPGFAALEVFDRIIAEAIAGRADLDRRHLGKTLVEGARLHDTFAVGAPLATALRAAFVQAATEYPAFLGVAPDHPVRHGMPPAIRIESWANVMTAAAFELAHIHDGSWISGVYYPELPGAAPADELPDAGAIEFGGHDFGAALKVAGPTRMIRPAPGMLVMFPSYLYHRTVPFRAPGRRVSIAFVAKADTRSR